MTTLADYAKEATRQIGRWYGQRQFFAAPKEPSMSCEQFLLAHWRRFPSTDPTGGKIIDGEAVELHGFIEQPPNGIYCGLLRRATDQEAAP